MPRTSRPLDIHPIFLRTVTVTKVEQVTAHMRRVTLAGGEMRAGRIGDLERPAFVSEGFDDHDKLVIPPSGTPAEGDTSAIGQQQAQRFAWNREALARTRDYTVRRHDPATDSFVIDLVDHSGGLASDWAASVAPGERISFAGPKSCAHLDTTADFHLLVADETALPAVGRWLEEAPAGTRGHVIVEVPAAEDIAQIPTRAEVTIDWIVRADDVPPGESTALETAVRALELPSGRTYAWAAGEALSMAPIRRHLREERGLPKPDVEVIGYWRRPSQTKQALADVHEMAELLPPILLRVLVTLGIPRAIAEGHDTLPLLAECTAVGAAALARVLDAAESRGLVARVGEPERTALRWANTSRGEALLDDSAVAGLDLADPLAREVLDLVGLLGVLRDPSTAPEATAGAASAGSSATPGLRTEVLAEELAYVLDPLGKLPGIAGADSLVVAGPGAPVIAGHLGAGRTVHQPRLPTGTTESAPWPEAAACVLVDATRGRTLEELAPVLDAALAASPVLVLVEKFADGMRRNDHLAEELLVRLARTGRAPVTTAQVSELARARGAEARTTLLGWGFGPFGTALVVTRG